ncbi:MAG TPA: hypothetical protein VFM93_06495 [Candidatus Limnocylindria bacterium]|nr:hypothetical protein [Candidatus Limnocylindria bacterium]
MPPIDRRAILIGAVLSLLFSIPGITFVGALIGGSAAGALAGRDGGYHGAVVGIATILAVALLPIPSPSETAEILAFDAILIGIGAAGGWLGARVRPSS